MSGGWRSGSAGGTSQIDGVEIPGAARTRRRSLGSLVVLGVLVAVGSYAWITTESRRPPHRMLPPPARSVVVLVPIGDVPADRVRDLPRDYSDEYGLTVTLDDGIALPATAFDAARRQYAAEDVMATLAASRPDAVAAGSVVIGLTAADIYLRELDWSWVFAARDGSQVAVVSLARMRGGRVANLNPLFRRMLTRQIGFLCFELPASDNPYDVLYRDIRSVWDLARTSDHL